jgi:hypothetical protein
MLALANWLLRPSKIWVRIRSKVQVLTLFRDSRREKKAL